MLKTRVKTGAVLTVLAGVILLLSRFAWVLPAAGAALCLMGVYELTRATGFLKNKWDFALTAVVTVLLNMVRIPYYSVLTAVCLAAALGISLWLMDRVGKQSRVPSFAARVLALVMPVFFRAMAELRLLEHGMYLLLLTFLLGAVTDMAAYFVGRLLGKHPLAPTLSPHKPQEGSIGGVLGTVALLTPLTAILMKDASLHWGRLILFLAVGSLVGQFGDLAMSAVKRIVGIKDFSRLLPGHGGSLDRMDSTMFILPFSYLFYICFPWIG